MEGNVCEAIRELSYLTATLRGVEGPSWFCVKRGGTNRNLWHRLVPRTFECFADLEFNRSWDLIEPPPSTRSRKPCFEGGAFWRGRLVWREKWPKERPCIAAAKGLIDGSTLHAEHWRGVWCDSRPRSSRNRIRRWSEGWWGVCWRRGSRWGCRATWRSGPPSSAGWWSVVDGVIDENPHAPSVAAWLVPRHPTRRMPPTASGQVRLAKDLSLK